MTRQNRFLVPMLVFIAAVGLVAAMLYRSLAEAFVANAALNGLILGVLALGIGYVLRQVMRLNPEIKWIAEFAHAQATGAPAPAPQLLAPLATMLDSASGTFKMTTVTMRSLADSVAARLDERREISRYLVGLLVFLGLLGTFWGLIQTITSIKATIAGLSVDTADPLRMFAGLKQGLEKPLGGMGTAFSSSLFGLAGSLMLGFLDLQLGQAQTRFFTEFEDWLASHTRLGRAMAVEGESGGAMPSYVEALMSQTADSLEAMERQAARSDRDKREISSALGQLAETIAALADHIQAERHTLENLVQGQRDIVDALSQQPETLSQPVPFDSEALGHLRAIDVSLKRLLEAQDQSREQLSEDLHLAFRRMTKSLAAMIDSGAQAPVASEEGDGR
ncbi:MAG: flagellar motor protein MotA [Alphaproteobacteria bacterium]|nr:MAG: flagellar motor protein MotA [Alphaproteobacteria bacterium]